MFDEKDMRAFIHVLVTGCVIVGFLLGAAVVSLVVWLG